MHMFSLVSIWLFIISSCMQKQYSSSSSSEKEPVDVEEFFDQMEKVMDKLMVESKSENTAQPSETRKLRYLIPEAVANREIEEESIYNHGHKLGEAANSLLPNRNNLFYSSDDMDARNSAVGFEGYRDFIFRPLYPCDSYDSAQKHCILRRQLGTTLTLGVQVGEGSQGGMRIYWYRCLRKKYFDHIIKEPLNKGFLPWNLNLGGSSNELRISPISEMDLSYNYFIAELVAPQAFRSKYSQKPTIRFEIESIEIDMGLLYHGEEIVIYARSFVELPRTSVNFLWSLQEKNDFEDRGLPSNMQLNADKSSVIIKELKTYQDQHLVCKIFSNKDFLLAKRTFLFRGFGKNNSNDTLNHIRLKRYAEGTEQPYGESNKMHYEKTEDLSNIAQLHNPEKEHDHLDVPEISPDLFYINGKKDTDRPQELSYERMSSPSRNAMARIMRRFIEKDESEINKSYRTKELPQFEKPRFEDVESQMIATCRTHSDCNVRATCIRETNYGQNYCKCSHGFNGNGLFCYSS